MSFFVEYFVHLLLFGLILLFVWVMLLMYATLFGPIFIVVIELLIFAA